MKKKRILAMFMTIILTLGLCVACGTQEAETDSGTEEGEDNKP